MSKYYILGLVIEAIILFIPIGTLIYKYAKVVSNVEENAKDISELKEVQKTYQATIEKSLDEIKNCLNTLNITLATIGTRLDIMEKKKC